MIRSLRRLLLIAALPLGLVSCAAGSLVPDRESMPAARASLLPEYRIFYDSLQDYGDWVLIEPFGYVFRPRVNFVAWKPYEDGFWAPTDVYGWTWISSEPFGWATYHYGTWTFDSFQGWVWVPGADWGPAWVAWNANQDYVGWAPQLAPGSPGYNNVPGGAFTFIPVQELGSTNLKSKVLDPAKLDKPLTDLKPVMNLAQVDGVRINRGPSIDWVEQKTGPLTRVKIQDLVRPGDLATLRDRGGSSTLTPGTGASNGMRAPTGGLRPVSSPDSTRNAANEAARETRALEDRGVIGPRVPVVRPFGVGARRGPAPSAPPIRAKAPKTARDTTRTK
jgi:hypothetical protein